MAPALLLRNDIPGEWVSRVIAVGRPGARETQAARRHGHFGLKPPPAALLRGPQRSDFRPEKERDN